jgi:hypothetical protein
LTFKPGNALLQFLDLVESTPQLPHPKRKGMTVVLQLRTSLLKQAI